MWALKWWFRESCTLSEELISCGTGFLFGKGKHALDMHQLRSTITISCWYPRSLLVFMIVPNEWSHLFVHLFISWQLQAISEFLICKSKVYIVIKKKKEAKYILIMKLVSKMLHQDRWNCRLLKALQGTCFVPEFPKCSWRKHTVMRS